MPNNMLSIQSFNEHIHSLGQQKINKQNIQEINDLNYREKLAKSLKDISELSQSQSFDFLFCWKKERLETQLIEQFNQSIFHLSDSKIGGIGVIKNNQNHIEKISIQFLDTYDHKCILADNEKRQFYNEHLNQFLKFGIQKGKECKSGEIDIQEYESAIKIQTLMQIGMSHNTLLVNKSPRSVQKKIQETKQHFPKKFIKLQLDAIQHVQKHVIDEQLKARAQQIDITDLSIENTGTEQNPEYTLQNKKTGESLPINFQQRQKLGEDTTAYKQYFLTQHIEPQLKQKTEQTINDHLQGLTLNNITDWTQDKGAAKLNDKNTLKVIKQNLLDKKIKETLQKQKQVLLERNDPKTQDSTEKKIEIIDKSIQIINTIEDGTIQKLETLNEQCNQLLPEQDSEDYRAVNKSTRASSTTVKQIKKLLTSIQEAQQPEYVIHATLKDFVLQDNQDWLKTEYTAAADAAAVPPIPSSPSMN